MKIVEVSKKDLIYNIGIIRSKIKEAGLDDNGEEREIIAVVKGNGYGLGLVEYTNFLIDHGFDFFAVSTAEEAVALRKAGIDKKILTLLSTAVKEDLEALIDNNIIITIGSKEVGETANEMARKKGKEIEAHIKIDTGMGRYGFIYTKPEELLSTIKEFTNIKITGMFTHFSSAFNVDKTAVESQFKKFIDIVEILRMNDIDYGLLHICNSEAFLRFPHMYLNAVRIGSAFVGLISDEEAGLKRVGIVKTKVAEIKTLPKGHNIGYGNTYTTKKETKVAIIRSRICRWSECR